VADEVEIRLARVAVSRGFITQEQALALIRRRNEAPDGADIGALLVQEGWVPAGAIEGLQAAVASGNDTTAMPRPRHEMSTEHEISLGSTREVIARECLNEALSDLEGNRELALRELERLAEEFPDTESGLRARERLRELKAEG